MKGKEDILRAANGDDPMNSTAEYGNDLLRKMVSKIEVLLR